MIIIILVVLGRNRYKSIFMFWIYFYRVHLIFWVLCAKKKGTFPIDNGVSRVIYMFHYFKHKHIREYTLACTYDNKASEMSKSALDDAICYISSRCIAENRGQIHDHISKHKFATISAKI